MALDLKRMQVPLDIVLGVPASLLLMILLRPPQSLVFLILLLAASAAFLVLASHSLLRGEVWLAAVYLSVVFAAVAIADWRRYHDPVLSVLAAVTASFLLISAVLTRLSKKSGEAGSPGPRDE